MLFVIAALIRADSSLDSSRGSDEQFISSRLSSLLPASELISLFFITKKEKFNRLFIDYLAFHVFVPQVIVVLKLALLALIYVD
jgi:hypothetical protein